MRDRLGLVAMLLRTDFDHAKTRQDLFANHPAFLKSWCSLSVSNGLKIVKVSLHLITLGLFGIGKIEDCQI